MNGKLADLWHYSKKIQHAIEEVVSGNAERGATELYIWYGMFEDNVVWFRQGTDRAYRNIWGGNVLDPPSDQRESVQDLISAWWPREDTEREAAAAIVKLRKLARKVSVDLCDRDLLAMQAENVPSRARKTFMRRLERLRDEAENVLRLAR